MAATWLTAHTGETENKTLNTTLHRQAQLNYPQFLLSQAHAYTYFSKEKTVDDVLNDEYFSLAMDFDTNTRSIQFRTQCIPEHDSQ